MLLGFAIPIVPAAAAVATFGIVTSSAVVTASPVTWPSVQANDIALLFVASAEGSADFYTVTGFTSISLQQSSNMTTDVLWKRCTGSETGTLAVALDGGTSVKIVLIIVRGAITTGTPFQGGTTSDATGASVSQSTPGAGLAVAGARLALRFGAIDTAQVSSPPSGYTEYLENATGAATITVDTKDIASASTIAQSTRTISSANWSVQLIAMIPAP